jgi:hypothetical protein
LPFDLVEIAVLPGRRRGIWSRFARGPQSDGGVRTFTSSVVRSAAISGGRLERIELEGPGGTEAIAGDHFALSMGVIDSNLFVDAFLREAIPPSAAAAAGRFLHDHWSVPLARLRWKNDSALHAIFPPRFARGGVVGGRLAFHDGFFHLMATFDSIAPYDRVKKFLALRQQGASLARAAQAGLSCFGRPLLMARAGAHYLARRELYVSDGTELTLSVDFESAAAPENRIRRGDAGVVLDWDVRAADVGRFGEIVDAYRPVLDEFAVRDGVTIGWLVPDDSASRERYLREFAIDAYHMGGGLQATPGVAGVTEIGGAIRGVPNLRALGTAVFARPGPANPVLTLLALADIAVDELVSARRLPRVRASSRDTSNR